MMSGAKKTKKRKYIGSLKRTVKQAKLSETDKERFK